MNQVIIIAEDSRETIKIVKQLTWAEITDAEMRERLQQLFPREEPDEPQTDELQQIKEEHLFSDKDYYYTYLAEQSQSLQQRASPILKNLTFNLVNSSKPLIEAIQHFRDKQGVVTKTAPTRFLKDEDKAALIDERQKFQISLYKMLLFQEAKDAIKRGSLNLKYSFKYKAMDDYLIPKHLWDKDPDIFLDKANLSHLKDFRARVNDFKKMIAFHFEQTNDNILSGKNKYFRKRKNNRYYVVTPKVNKEENDTSIFPGEASIPLSEVLSTIDSATCFLEELQHLQPVYRKQRPDKSVFFAGITAFGCNLGIPAMAKAAAGIHAHQLENTANWYFSLENINRANDAITNFYHQIAPGQSLSKKTR